MAKTFPQLREKWEFELTGKDPNAIESQLLNMTWDFASFKMLAKALEMAPRESDGSLKRSGLFIKLVERSFAHRVLIFTRRMVDRSAGSISLVRTLQEMEHNSSVMTRKALIDGDGLVYDYEPIRQQFNQWLTLQGNGAFCVPQELHWERHEDRHVYIDRMTCKVAASRSETDVIPRSFFANLRKRVEAAGAGAKKFVDSHVAHSEKPQSRIIKGADSVSLSFSDLESSLRTFCEVVSILKLTVLWQSSGQWLAMPLDDQLAFVDQPMVEPSQVDELRGTWLDFENATEAWANWGIDEYLAEFGG
jgi:hypothetical protein